MIGQRGQHLDQRQGEALQFEQRVQLALDARGLRLIAIHLREFQAKLLLQAAQAPRPAIAPAHHGRIHQQFLPGEMRQAGFFRALGHRRGRRAHIAEFVSLRRHPIDGRLFRRSLPERKIFREARRRASFRRAGQQRQKRPAGRIRTRAAAAEISRNRCAPQCLFHQRLIALGTAQQDGHAVESEALRRRGAEYGARSRRTPGLLPGAEKNSRRFVHALRRAESRWKRAGRAAGPVWWTCGRPQPALAVPRSQ